jgi:hypothetical protein
MVPVQYIAFTGNWECISDEFRSFWFGRERKGESYRLPLPPLQKWWGFWGDRQEMGMLWSGRRIYRDV